MPADSPLGFQQTIRQRADESLERAAAQRLIAGEVDYLEYVPLDLIPVVRRDRAFDQDADIRFRVKHDVAVFTEVLAINLTGTMRCCALARDKLKAAGVRTPQALKPLVDKAKAAGADKLFLAKAEGADDVQIFEPLIR